jgi:hypothetical protein
MPFLVRATRATNDLSVLPQTLSFLARARRDEGKAGYL